MCVYQSACIILSFLCLGFTGATPDNPYAPVFDTKSPHCDTTALSHRGNFTHYKSLRSNVQLWVVVVIFLLVGLLSALIAVGFHAIRRVVYRDNSNLDVTFDAGGKMSISLVAASLVSQFTWTMDLLYPTTTAVRYGISGPYWYAMPCLLMLTFLSFLTLHFKIRAPGAKTLMQIVRARFGKATHTIYCIFALFANVLVLAALVAAGCDVLSKLVDGLNPEMCAILLAAVIGCYTLIGGLGATLYFCYFNTIITFIGIMSIITEVYFNPFEHKENIFGSVDSIYQYVSCIETRENNFDNSYFTFKSQSWIYVCLIILIGYPGVIFCDQSNWQCAVATKPLESTISVIIAGLTFIAVPLSIGTSMGLSYLGMSSAQGKSILTSTSVDQGLAAPTVMQILLGSYGEYLTIVMILMAIMSTGSAEVIAAVSVIIYDIFQVYIQPFRPDVKEDVCILCQKPYQVGSIKTVSECRCTSMLSCTTCTEDTASRNKCKSLVKPYYTCAVHGSYRQYLDHLIVYTNWCILWVTILIIPLQIFCNNLGFNISWFFLCCGVFLGAAAIPLTSTLLWARANSKGMICGALGGLVCGVTSWLSLASTYPGGLSNFFLNTEQNIPVVVGNLTSFFSSGLILVVVTLVTSKPLTKEDVSAVWEKTRNIDNPLRPWNEEYSEEFGIVNGEYYYDRPSEADIEQKFRKAKIAALSASGLILILFAVVWPLILESLKVLTITGFRAWITTINVWSLGFGCFIIIGPIVQEVIAAYRANMAFRKG